MSSHISAQYGIECRTCGAAADKACRTLTTGRVTDTHQDRIWRRHVEAKKAAQTRATAPVSDSGHGSAPGAVRDDESASVARDGDGDE